MTTDPDRLTRAGEIVRAVARQLLTDRGARRFALLDDGSPESGLASMLLAPLGEEAVVKVPATGTQVESVLHALGEMKMATEAVRVEAARMLTRLIPDAVPANPANRTTLLLARELPPEPFLPLGDLLATEVESLHGGWSAPPEVQRLAEAAGGIGALDAALRAHFDARDPTAFESLPERARERVTAALRAGSAARYHPRVVPKFGPRTLGVDLFE